jgi:drug/metabolite transporter (DMT)-like permease
MLLAASVLWGVNFTAVKVGVTSMSPLLYADLRFGGAGLAMVAVLVLRGEPLLCRRADLPLLVVAAFVGTTLGQVAFVYAMTLTSASNTALLQATVPIFTAVLVIGLGRERLSWRLWGGLLFGLLGVALVVNGARGGSGGASPVGDLLALATALAFASYGVLIARLVDRYSAYQVSAWIMLLAGLFLAPGGVAGALATPLATIPAAGWLALTYSMIGAVLITNALYFTAIHRLGAAHANLFLYLEAFLGVLFAVIFLGEPVTFLQLIGGIVVVASVAVGTSRRSPARRPAVMAGQGPPDAAS